MTIYLPTHALPWKQVQRVYSQPLSYLKSTSGILTQDKDKALYTTLSLTRVFIIKQYKKIILLSSLSLS